MKMQIINACVCTIAIDDKLTCKTNDFVKEIQDKMFNYHM